MSFSYTNTTAADEYLRSTQMGMVSNYARVEDEPNVARVSNKTASLEQPELITYRSKPIAKVDTAIAVRNPGPVKDGVLYSVRVETVDRYTDAVGNPIDEPIVMWVNIMHSVSNNWTNAKIAQVFGRMMSALLKEQESTGTPSAAEDAEWRFEDLMKSALMPASN